MPLNSGHVPSGLLGRAFSLTRLYLSEYHTHIRSIDLWYNGAAVMIRHPLDPPNELENDGENWHHVGTLPE